MANVTFPFPFPDHLITLLPEMIVAIMAMALLLIDVFITKGSKVTAYLAILTTIVAGVATVSLQSSEPLVAFYGFFVFDSFAVFSKVLIYIATAMAMILSLEFMKDEKHVGEYYVLMLFAMLGMMLMVSSNNFVTMYLGLELMALSVYVLVAFQREVLRANEAALKYFILGALSSGMLLYGVTFLYGVTGSFEFAVMGEKLTQGGGATSAAVMLGLVFLIAGLGFKVSMAPFHMWTPDAYEGAPSPITAFMSVAPKVAGFVVFMRIVVDLLPSLQPQYEAILTGMAVLTIAIGNLAAIAQRNIKRMLAYSTVGHVGFVMLGLLAGTAAGFSGILVYLSIYLVMTMGVFAVIILMRREGIQGELLDDFAGLSRVRPGYALAMGLFMFSMAGIPFLGGFWAKYVVFIAAVEAGHLYLVLFALLFSAVGAFYYLRVVKYIYFDEERVAFNFIESKPMQATVIVTAILIVAIGVFPDPLLEMCRQALGGLV
ncbi:NADH dehydrogenase subunit N [Mariprofundus ferrinatatus]|uniref:NADH-quinone oxidoreductase subunit N n=1 Tax=Mariprofundus ferrinatatus TaxID=1921087 RepID=A0A2K8L5U4_9PROT|nr:NADH-quinone oxidoreductase subunit N [Mariprofundus ferrinatatus]ATX82657.1 NADH dehydrogenase subunit N [Mariprofundus ferrinatatus]